ncbi:MAG: ABC transporter ATP-binding protein [Desulfurococcales archaeon]|nr:ABC transporter ATP-binding protein [Desulfurococcales archaeon]
MRCEHVYSTDIGEKILEANNLKVWFPVSQSFIDNLKGKAKLYVHAVDGISFEVHERETFCLVGESGCGKTTTGKAILRLVPVTSGSVIFKPSKSVLSDLRENGVSVDSDGRVDLVSIPQKKFKPLRRDLQIVYQDPYGSMNPRYRIRDVVGEAIDVHKMVSTREEKEEMIIRVLDKVRLTPAEDFIDRYPHQLSGGQRQRVAIARAIILNPRLVIADEPVSMLDVSIRAEILELFNELKRDIGLSYIFITHDLAVARYVCNRIAVMYLGKIVEMGEAREIISDPLHPYTKALVAAIPDPNPENRKKIREVPIIGEVPSAINIPPGCRFHPRCVYYNRAVGGQEGMAKLVDKCPKEEPPFKEVKPGRRVACWLHD